MIAGIGFTAAYIIGCVFFKMEPWTFGIFAKGINPQGIGSIGMVINFVVTLGLTPFCRAPDESIRLMVDSVREPEGIGPPVDIEAAPEH